MSQLSTAPAPQATDFADILADLAQLSRNHLVFFRLAVGRLLGEVQAQFAEVAGQRLSARRRARLHAALDQPQAQIDGMRGRLGAP